MRKFSLLLALAAAGALSPVMAADADPCAGFAWNVTHEVALMKGAGEAVAAASAASASVPTLDVDKLYALALKPQSQVTFAVPPGKPMLADGSQAGLVQFRVPEAGRYRVSITSTHWLDVVDGTSLVLSKDFQGNRGCARPHKIVEFELPAGKDLLLQLSGGTDANVSVTITPVPAAAKAS